MKTCPDCLMQKPLSDFSKDASRPDGRQFYCRVCFARRGADSYRRRQERLGKKLREKPEPVDGHKWCHGCKTMQPLENWHKNRTQRDGLVSRCKDCRRTEGHADHLRRTFGITVEERELLLERQGGVCAVCGDENPTHTDHDHVSGKVRGLLCGRCNLGIGLFLDEPARMHAAVAYLERTSTSAETDAVRRRLQRLFPQTG
jgi:hypothetical protein